jgi:DNA mismatch repair ATPase MutS
LLAQVAGQEFKLEWLKKTGEDAKKMSVAILQFKKLVHLFEARSNGLTGPIMNTLFLFDFYCLLRLESWRKNHRQSLIEAMDMMIETDVLISSAVYAFNHPDYIYPTITDSGCVITASGLRHPLLSQKAAVGNDAILGEKEQFYLLTGANMTGKSTFIRTIGVSIVIGNAGLPFPAKALSLPLLDLYTSMRITDSVQEDISYFRAELNRVKMIMDKVKTAARPCLVLLDEPLRGTNSTDKQQGTRSIVETLLSYHAIGIVATHDTGLCDMELLHKGQVSNYHFESQVETGGLSFDFKLKPGGSTSNNATALMRQMGIIH